MKPESHAAEVALKTICLKTQIVLVRNVAQYPFPTQSTRATTVPIQVWLTQIADIHPFDDLTDDLAFAHIAEHRYGLADVEERHPAYRLLRFQVACDSGIRTFWCELMACNHFTFSVTSTELDFNEAVADLERFTDRFAEVFHFAYDEQFGYLTSQPTLTGTGLRIRSWIHLSGLASLNYLPQLCRAAEVKGVLTEYMPNEEPPAGDIFILYNRFSLNLPTDAIVRDYKAFLLRLARQEMRARMRLAHDRVAHLYDELLRALLLCRHALIVPEREAQNLLSSYWTGCSCGALEPIDDPAYAFNDCFDSVRDALCPQSLLNLETPHALGSLPPICRQEYLLNYDILRALWLRKLSEAKFTPAFLSRVNRL
jgi:protein arginine kinase